MRRDDRFKSADLRRVEAEILAKLAAEGLTLASPWREVIRCLAGPNEDLRIARLLRERDGIPT